MNINPETVANDKQRIVEFLQECDDFVQQIDDTPAHQQEDPPVVDSHQQFVWPTFGLS